MKAFEFFFQLENGEIVGAVAGCRRCCSSIRFHLHINASHHQSHHPQYHLCDMTYLSLFCWLWVVNCLRFFRCYNKSTLSAILFPDRGKQIAKQRSNKSHSQILKY